MARTTEQRNVKVVGGPGDGMHMVVKLKDDGSVQVPFGSPFLGEDGGQRYRYDAESDTLVYIERD